jgi:hypothetical protein
LNHRLFISRLRFPQRYVFRPPSATLFNRRTQGAGRLDILLQDVEGERRHEAMKRLDKRIRRLREEAYAEFGKDR